MSVVTVKAESILRQFEQMVSDRSNHETTWRKIAEVLRPLRKNFNTQNTTSGERRHQKVYHSGPLMALSNFKAGMYGRLTNPATDWFEIRIAGDEEINDYASVRTWREEVTRRLRLSFSPAMSGFYNQTPAMYADLGAFGTGLMFTREIPGQGRFHDATISLEEAYIDKNQWNEIDTVARKFRLTARQAMQKFGEKCSDNIKNAEKQTPMSPFEFLHMVRPNPEYKEGAIGPNGFSFESVYIEYERKNIVLEEGFYDMPYHCPRWEVAAGETYGRGQGEMILADILSTNAARRSNLTMAERQSNPTLLAAEEKAMRQGVRAYPGAVVYGGMSSTGQQLVRALDEGKNLNLSVEYENMLNDAVKDAFYFSLMQIQGSNDMTATEYLGREQETMRLLGPHVGQIENEFLTPLIKRRYSMLESAFQIPPAPDEIGDMPLEIQYVSPLARLQRVEKASGAMRSLEGLMAAAQLDPAVADRFDADGFADIMEEGLGSGILLSREEAEEKRSRREQQQQTQMMMEQAPGLAKAAKDVSEVPAMQEVMSNAAA